MWLHVQGDDMSDAMIGFKYYPVMVKIVESNNNRMARKLQETPVD
jgi:hypothetical protein